MTKINIDLTTLSGWDDLEAGNHSITIKAKATGYRDSEASQAVTVTKEAPQPQGETWVINENPNITQGYLQQSIPFTSNNVSYVMFNIGFTFVGSLVQAVALSYDISTIWGQGGPGMPSGWANQDYRTVTFETAPTGELLTWLQANAVKQ